jgi:hypothetical protein
MPMMVAPTRNRSYPTSSAVGYAHSLISLREESAKHSLWLAESQAKGRAKEFTKLANEWRVGRGYESSAKAMASHPAYQQIIGMGFDALPFLFRELETQPDHWFWALWAITRQDPVLPEHRGRLRLMAEDWIRWARSNGFTW